MSKLRRKLPGLGAICAVLCLVCLVVYAQGAIRRATVFTQHIEFTADASTVGESFEILHTGASEMNIHQDTESNLDLSSDGSIRAWIDYDGDTTNTFSVLAGTSPTTVMTLNESGNLDVTGLISSSALNHNARFYSSLPGAYFEETDQTGDGKIWRLLSQGGTFYIAAQNSTFSGDDGIRMTRTAGTNTVSSIVLDGTAVSATGTVDAIDYLRATQSGASQYTLTLEHSAANSGRIRNQSIETNKKMLYFDNVHGSEGGTPSGSLSMNWRIGASSGPLTYMVLSEAGNLSLPLGDFIITTPTTPASAAATGEVGTIAWDTNYVYVCVATNTWKRAALSTW